MNKVLKRTFCLLLLLLTNSLLAQQSEIRFLNTEISVDGKLDESVWNQLEEVTGFFNYMPTDEGLAKNQTVVKIYHNGEYLFVGAVYHDTTERRQVSSLKRDVSIGISDAFIMVLDTQNQEQNGNLFAVNAYGTQVDALVERLSTGYGLNFSWSTIWKARAQVEGTKKIYEIAIPLKTLNFRKENTVFGVQFYTRDIKNNSWTILENVKRNFPTFDLRFTRKFNIQNLPERSASRYAITPSLTVNHQKDVEADHSDTNFKPSLDVQYNLTSSLKLDATMNPDFSQIDVDQQVTNLTRFSIFFPERRNFFLENADLFSNLGTFDVNPFYSRRIGANSDVQFGMKLSGNISPKTRIGIMNVQTGEEGSIQPQNFSALVAEQQLSERFAVTGFLINKQETEKLRFVDNYNRVTGVNLNYKSKNNKWTGLINLGKSFNDGISNKNHFYHAGIWYTTRGLSWDASVKQVQRNYIAETGFTPRLYNYDAINDQVIREGYTQTSGRIEYRKFYDKSKTINWVRYFNYVNDHYFDEQGKLIQSSHFLNSAIFFKDLSAVYYVVEYDIVDLKYGFDPLGNGNSLVPEIYRFGILKLGYNSANNQKFRYRFNVQKGSYYGGDRMVAGAYLNYQLLPFANIEVSYDLNDIDLKELGKETFHLTRFTGEVFFNTRLNWTTYVQHNTQRDNFNINSRLQWEYKPLSYIYLVVTDNFNQYISRKNWGVSFKMNFRFDL